jgi:putative transcriptional regulator
VVFTKGRLLVATPPLSDPNFDRTVVLMMEHNEDGAFGLVLNRPGDTQLAAVLPDWASQAMWPTVVFHGGPVQTDAVIALARRSQAPEGEGWLPILGDLGTVDLASTPDEVGALDALRVFAGYSGWGPRQLDGELSANAWMVVDADPSDPFTADPTGLWRHVLGRQPGSVGWMRNFPDDVSTN